MPLNGSGIHEGQKTGALIRLASACQPARSEPVQPRAATGLASVLVAGAALLPPQPATASARAAPAAAARILTHSRVQPIQGNPRSAVPVPGREVEGARLPPQLPVEARLQRVALARCEHSVRDRAGD